MFYRTIAVFIVLFWLTMTGLLVHRQVRPADAALREIPISHVVKLFFRPRQEHVHPQLLINNTNLHLGNDDFRVGKVTEILPETDPQTKDHHLSFAGEFQLIIPNDKRRQRIAVRGNWEMDKDFATRRFQLSVTTHVPTDLTTQVEILPAENLARYKMTSPTGVLVNQAYPLDETGARRALTDLGIDSELIPPLPARRFEPEIKATARLSTFPVREGEIDTYLVTIESNGQTLLEAHVDQLGRIVHVDCPLLGYSLVTEDPSP